MTRKMRRTEPFIQEIDPLGNWEYFSNASQKELKDLKGWNSLIKSKLNIHIIDSGNLVSPFPSLSAVRFWAHRATMPIDMNGNKTLTNRTKIHQEMCTISTRQKGTVDKIIDLLDGKLTIAIVAFGTEYQEYQEYGMHNDAQRISPLMLWDFTTACVNLCHGNQCDQGPSREAGNIQTFIVNQRIREWVYSQKAKGMNLTSKIPPKEIIEEINEEVQHILSRVNKINWAMGFNMDNQRTTMLSKENESSKKNFCIDEYSGFGINTLSSIGVRTTKKKS